MSTQTVRIRINGLQLFKQKPLQSRVMFFLFIWDIAHDKLLSSTTYRRDGHRFFFFKIPSLTEIEILDGCPIQ